MYFQNRNASYSSNHVAKIADRLGCLGFGAHTGRKNPRHRNIVKITDSCDLRDKWEPGLITYMYLCSLPKIKVKQCNAVGSSVSRN